MPYVATAASLLVSPDPGVGHDPVPGDVPIRAKPSLHRDMGRVVEQVQVRHQRCNQ